MKHFNGELKSKDELQKYTKEQLIDMYWDMGENNKKFMKYLFEATPEEFVKLKIFYKVINGEFDPLIEKIKKQIDKKLEGKKYEKKRIRRKN